MKTKRHGRGGYAGGCRCHACVAANRAYSRTYIAARKQAGIADSHGSPSEEQKAAALRIQKELLASQQMTKTPEKQLAMVRDWARRHPKQAQTRNKKWADSAKGKSWLKQNQAKKNAARDAWRARKRAAGEKPS